MRRWKELHRKPRVQPHSESCTSLHCKECQSSSGDTSGQHTKIKILFTNNNIFPSARVSVHQTVKRSSMCRNHRGFIRRRINICTRATSSARRLVCYLHINVFITVCLRASADHRLRNPSSPTPLHTPHCGNV